VEVAGEKMRIKKMSVDFFYDHSGMTEPGVSRVISSLIFLFLLNSFSCRIHGRAAQIV
jgi:hypothetical protein